jgi:hypothetical protein
MSESKTIILPLYILFNFKQLLKVLEKIAKILVSFEFTKKL